MDIGPGSALAQLSDAIAAQVAAAAPMLVAIRVGPNRHISGMLWQQDLVITSDQLLPAQDNYTVVLSGGVLTGARPARRYANSELASLRLDGTAYVAPFHPAAEPRVGTLALALAADADAAPVAHLTMIRKVSGNAADRALSLDMPAELVAEGGPVLDAGGGLLGLAALSGGGEPIVIPQDAIQRLISPVQAHISVRRGWLGVALQPITVPEAIRNATGFTTGRMIVSLAPSGPAERAAR
jgi:S1-C subfamily serine protease